MAITKTIKLNYSNALFYVKDKVLSARISYKSDCPYLAEMEYQNAKALVSFFFKIEIFDDFDYDFYMYKIDKESKEHEEELFNND